MKNILFDLYGTLVDIETDEESAAFWRKISELLLQTEEEGEAIKARYRSLCRSAEAELPPAGEFDLLAIFRALLSECGNKTLGAEELAAKFRRLSLKRLRLFSGTKAMLAALKRAGAGVYLLSNAQACFTRGEIKVLGLTPFFNGILLSSEAGWKKPSPQFFEAAFSRFSLSPETCLYAGNDHYDDVGGAHGAGMKCVYIKSPQSGVYENPPVPDFVAENRNRLTEILLGFVK